MQRPDIIAAAAWAFIAANLVLFLLYVFPASAPFPRSNEWTYVDAASYEGLGLLRWAFAQQVENRMPLQKLLQLALLELNGFDFRALPAVDYLLAGAFAAVVLAAARACRGSSRWGDLAIAAIALDPAAYAMQWGFLLFQLAPAFLVAVALWFTMAFERTGRLRHLLAALAALVACGWWGFAGLVLSTVLAVALAGHFLIDFGRKAPRHPWLAHMLALAVVLNDIVLWAIWRPSHAMVQHHASAGARIRGVLGMLEAPFGVAGADLGWLKAAVLAAILAAALIIGIGVLLGARPGASPVPEAPPPGGPLCDVALAAALAGSLILMATVGSLQAQEAPWSIDKDVYFAPLAYLAPAAAWIILSARADRRLANLCGLLLLVLFLPALAADWRVRLGQVPQDGARYTALQAGLRDAPDVRAFVDANIGEFFGVDRPEVRRHVADGIATLRQRGGYLYRPAR